MKTKFQILILTVAILLVGLWFYSTQRATRSTSFAGPEFHSRNDGDTVAVYSELSRHLVELGFKSSASPSEMDSWAGVLSEGARRIWFVRKEERNQSNYIYVDLDEIAVRTSVKWEIYGTSRKAQSAEKQAYALALDLDDWFDRYRESNTLPQKFREEKRRYFQKHLAENKKS